MCDAWAVWTAQRAVGVSTSANKRGDVIAAKSIDQLQQQGRHLAARDDVTSRGSVRDGLALSSPAVGLRALHGPGGAAVRRVEVISLKHINVVIFYEHAVVSSNVMPQAPAICRQLEGNSVRNRHRVVLNSLTAVSRMEQFHTRNYGQPSCTTKKSFIAFAHLQQNSCKNAKQALNEFH